MTVEIGELRHTSAGNVFRLERIDGERRYVRLVKAGDQDVPNGRVENWHAMHWEEGIPLVGGDTSGYPHFGYFVLN